MAQPLREALRHASLSIVGICKNAGKTTVLNRLLSLMHDDPRVAAITSIGRDGEAVDVVTGTEKPGVFVRAGTLVATASGLLRHCDATREILDATGFATPLGEVVVFRALSDGAVQLAGPSMVEQMAALVKTLRAFGADITIVDGAVGRRSPAVPAVSEAVILCAGASFSPDIDAVVAETAYQCQKLLLPVSPGESARRAVEGALTDAAAEALRPRPGDEISVADASRLLLSRMLFEKLRARGVRFTVRKGVALRCVCTNPFSASGPPFDARALREKVAAAVPVPVIDVKEADDAQPGP